jgi:hypothetical protein
MRSGIGVLSTAILLISAQAFASSDATCPVPDLASLRNQVLSRISELGGQLQEVQARIAPIVEKEIHNQNWAKGLTAAKWSAAALASGMVLNNIAGAVATPASAGAATVSNGGVNAIVSARQAINSTLGVITLVSATVDKGQTVVASHAPSLQEAFGRLDADFETEWYDEVGKGFEETVAAYDRGRQEIRDQTLRMYEQAKKNNASERKKKVADCNLYVLTGMQTGCELVNGGYRLIRWNPWEDRRREFAVLRSGLQAEVNLLNDQIEYMVRTYGRVDEHCRHARAQLARAEERDPRLNHRSMRPWQGESTSGSRAPARSDLGSGAARRAQ